MLVQTYVSGTVTVTVDLNPSCTPTRFKHSLFVKGLRIMNEQTLGALEPFTALQRYILR